MTWSAFFDRWTVVLRTTTAGVLGYIILIALLRVSGKRTRSKMNAFDLIVTISLGSILASIMLMKTVAVVQGVAAFTTLIAMQYLVTWTSVRSAFVRKMVKAEPTSLAF